ncbi:MAG: MptD family putative ECF transporter S component [Clostridia bacterium]|nr:MptD family putative ECF transporter S component [Clostridia bacterium]
MNHSTTSKLEVKDLINVGLFSALYIICYFGVSFMGFVPVLMLIVPLVCSIVGGIPFMLFLTKVKKFGMVTIMSVILAIAVMMTGNSWQVIPVSIVMGLAADLIMKSGNYVSKKKALLGYAVFSEWCSGIIVSMFFGFRDKYFASLRSGYGDEYINKLEAITPDWMFYVMVVLAFVGGLIGAVLGTKILKKHFTKAGIV